MTYPKLAQTCYAKGSPSAAEFQLLERFRQKYCIDQALADQLIADINPQTAHAQTAIEEYALMYHAFFSNDGKVDSEELAQLLDLQEELGLSNEQVATIEANVLKLN